MNSAIPTHRASGRISFALLVALACGACVPARAVPLSPRAQVVQARKSDPPAGARELGAVEAIHGSGCGGFGELGTYESTLAILRNRTAELGGDYVQIMTMSEPHLAGQCRVNEFTMRGIAYKLLPAQSVTLPATESGCSPICSPGYQCVAGTCVALCNPPCSPGFTCGNDRTCKAAGGAGANDAGAK